MVLWDRIMLFLKLKKEIEKAMEVKNGIIIDGVLHEAVNYSNDSYCSICSLRKECDELENRCDEWICRLIDCTYFVNRGKVTDIKIDKEE